MKRKRKGWTGRRLSGRGEGGRGEGGWMRVGGKEGGRVKEWEGEGGKGGWVGVWVRVGMGGWVRVGGYVGGGWAGGRRMGGWVRLGGWDEEGRVCVGRCKLI